MRLRLRTLLALPLLTPACGGGSPGTDEDTDVPGLTTASGSSGTDSEGPDSTTDADASSSGGACPEQSVCGDVCCGPEQACTDGMCVTVCEDERDPCGAEESCCGDGDICWLGTCVTPGAACEVLGCATSELVSGCGEGELCEPNLGVCVPSAEIEACIYEPPPATFDPRPVFSWGVRRERACTEADDCQTAEMCQAGTCQVGWPHIEPTDMPDHVQVMSVPAVIDLDQDCVPELVFNSYGTSTGLNDGVLRAIRGDDGGAVWTVDDPDYRLDGGTAPAIGDLDGDGTVEIVAKGTGSYLVAVGHDGTPIWRSDTFTSSTSRGSAAIADIDGDGLAEITYGRALYDFEGTLLWEGTAGVGINGSGPISCVADLDGDSRPELVAGDTAYAFTGTVAGGDFAGQVLWQGDAAGDGFCGIADFTGDGSPEVGLVASGVISILSGTTGATIASVPIPGGGNGGAPNIADFDGDGVPDIGTAGALNYVVVGYDGDDSLEVFWQAGTEDDSSNRTGSSVFDFDGDGRAEVIYNDEEYLRIYPGVEPDCALEPPGPDCDGIMTDAEVLFRDLSTSRTDTEYPVVADVDGDFKAELIIVNNNEASHLDDALRADAGIEVWDDTLDNWVATRPVWNQHSYHITNVGLLGEIPAVEDGAPFSSYRRNSQGDAESLCAPDLVPFGLEATETGCPSMTLSAFVLNQGCLGVGPGVQVAFYEAELGLLGVAETQAPLPAGGSEKVELEVSLDQGSNFEISVVVDDDGTGGGQLNECREENNTSEPLTTCINVG